MRVFVTGATGYVGSAVVRELMDAGHQVLGLVRSDAAADSLKQTGAAVHRGDLTDLDSLRAGAADADGVVHAAFNNVGPDTDFAASCRIELDAVGALGEALAGSDRPLVVTSGTGFLPQGRLATEEDAADPQSFLAIRSGMEGLALSFAARGVRVSLLRLAPSVHSDADKRGFLPTLVRIARSTGVSAYPGEGANRWPGVHCLDAARLYRLALESAPAGSRLHAVGEEGVPLREIAEVIGRHLGVPTVSLTGEQAEQHFDWIAHFVTLDNPTSNALTRQRLGWNPVHPALIPDLEAGHYFQA
ncbi:SDR family oxidoreductase [Streptacidiphilus albus]|uniref:SDR family oxidoreductase n=1 Tax=Streptacidiphilus albus TaxID=105425 RepID=UPI00054B34A3|nr:SDR family oxidoreductase [Streptacidiphilus albus]